MDSPMPYICIFQCYLLCMQMHDAPAAEPMGAEEAEEEPVIGPPPPAAAAADADSSDADEFEEGAHSLCVQQQ
jgi:hypothetical protein